MKTIDKEGIGIKDWSDRPWFIKNIGKEFMNGKEVHHNRENPYVVCQVLEHKEHVMLHNLLYERTKYDRRWW